MEQYSRFQLSASLEDYLEAIIYLERNNRVARVKDIANYLNVKMPSVTGALKILKERGLVNYQKNSYINLTEQGISIAQTVTAKHRLLIRFLEHILLLPHSKAHDMACQMEHILDGNTVTRLRLLMDKFEESVEEESWKEVMQKVGQSD